MNSLSPVLIDLNIGDQLTSVSCGHIVVELLKFLAYQRLQIPYTYQWLKQVVNKKKMCEDKKDTFQSERHFRIASNALDNLDFMIKSLLKEIDGPSIPEEVCIALGGTPVTCKEVYRLLLPNMCHKPQCHSPCIASDQKIQRSVFKTLVTSDLLSEVFFNTLPPTNLYVFIKKRNASSQDLVCTDSFVFVNGYKLPRNSKVIVLDLRTQSQENFSCCKDFQIFNDVINKNLVNLKISDNDSDLTKEDYSEIESTNMVSWYQSSYVMKGFKDCTVSGSSVTNKWLEL
ncbi:unnamed protein product [Parnassius mnemosyne]|uniref:Uncharacterized protein n=1 Tax=Parnassius mnemosyne TaxID=213953 RepID=A0AAV1KP03_9NEOP